MENKVIYSNEHEISFKELKEKDEFTRIISANTFDKLSEGHSVKLYEGKDWFLVIDNGHRTNPISRNISEVADDMKSRKYKNI